MAIPADAKRLLESAARLLAEEDPRRLLERIAEEARSLTGASAVHVEPVGDEGAPGADGGRTDVGAGEPAADLTLRDAKGAALAVLRLVGLGRSLPEGEGADLATAFAALAGAALAKASRLDAKRRIFDGFLRAAVQAVEQRDPTSLGHSFRVAALTRALAETVSAAAEGPYAAIQYDPAELDEIEVASLLHDIGKVGVREEVLVKAKKLYQPHLKMIRSRFDFIKRSIENDHLHRRLMMMEDGAPKAELAILDQASERAVSDIEECWRIITSANEPTMLEAGDFERIEEIATRSYFDLGGRRQPYLEPDEVRALQTAKGSLTPEELEDIRGHAAHTIVFLKQIPWTTELGRVPLYAGAHHERLDGSGYPHGLEGAKIPLPSRMMAIADVFDAVTAADRPYKKAVPLEQALDILALEVKDNHLDGELFRLFKEKRIYQVVEKP